jgi:hypothetical protein
MVVPERAEEEVTPIDPGVDLRDRLADQLEWLESAGFAASVVWRAADLAVISADRPRT